MLKKSVSGLFVLPLKPSEQHRRLIQVWAPYAHVMARAESCGAQLTFRSSPLPVDDPIAAMARFFIEGHLQIFDEWDTLKPVVHEMAHIMAWNEIFGSKRSTEVTEPVDWFLKNLLSESFANTVELLVFCGASVENQTVMSRLVYRYADMNLVSDLAPILRQGVPSEISGALLATFFVSNFLPYSHFLKDESLEECYARFGIQVSATERLVLKSIVVPCKTGERIKTQNQYYAHFGYPDFGNEMCKQNLGQLLDERPYLKAVFDRLALAAGEVLQKW